MRLWEDILRHFSATAASVSVFQKRVLRRRLILQLSVWAPELFLCEQTISEVLVRFAMGLRLCPLRCLLVCVKCFHTFHFDVSYLDIFWLVHLNVVSTDVKFSLCKSYLCSHRNQILSSWSVTSKLTIIKWSWAGSAWLNYCFTMDVISIFS